MTFALAADNYALPVFSETSSYTRLTQDAYDPFRVLRKDLSAVQAVTLYSARASLTRLTSLNEDWDGYGSARPNSVAIQHALGVIETLYQNAVSTGLPWMQPHITASEEGDVVFEWWNGAHKLTVYVGPESAEYIQVWGPDIAKNMADGRLVGERFQGLWRWLHA